MSDKPLTFEGVVIHHDPTFEALDQGKDPEPRAYFISEKARQGIEEAQAFLGRDLRSTTEYLAAMLHGAKAFQ